MKKLLLVLIAILMAFALVACDEENDPTAQNPATKPSTPPDPVCDVHYDGNDDGKCDECGRATTNNKANEGFVLTQAVMSQLEKAASAKIDVALDVVLDKDMWVYEEGAVADQSTYLKANALISVIAAKTENGINLKADLTVGMSMMEGVPAMSQTMTAFYLVDNVMYVYDSNYEMYLRSDVASIDPATMAQLATVVEALKGEIPMTEEELNAMLNELGKGLLDTFNVIDGTGSITTDMKDEVQMVIDYFASWDLEKDTIRSLLDELLAAMGGESDSPMTVEAIIAMLKNSLNMTVSQVLASIDQMMIDAYGVTLQQYYDAMVASEEVQAQLISILEKIVGEKMPEDVKEDLIAQLKGFKIAEVIPAEMMEMKLFDLILMLASSDDDSEGEGYTPVVDDEIIDDEPITLDEIEAMINQIIDTPIGALAQGYGIPLDMIIEALRGTTVEELNETLEIKLKNLFQIDYVSETTKLAIAVDLADAISGKDNRIDASLKLTVKIYGISTSKVTITAPKNSVEDIFDEYTVFDDDFNEIATVKLETDVDMGIFVTITTENETIYASVSYDSVEDYVVILEEPYMVVDDEAQYIDPIILCFDPEFGECWYEFETAE